jgi:hypothetical protein
MIRTINFSDFVDAFVSMGRGDQFSYAGLRALFEHIETWEEQTGEQIELDVIALCCEWEEYSTDELLIQFGDWLERYDDEDDADFAERIADAVGDIRGTIIRGDGIYIVSK